MVALEDYELQAGNDGTTESADPVDDTNNHGKMTYNEWRQLRKRRKTISAPQCLTKLQSLEVLKGYSVRLTVTITGVPTPTVAWTLDDEVIEENENFTFDNNTNENKYSLTISQISKDHEGTYKCTAYNSEGTDSTMGFITVKDTSRQRRRRSVSRKPLISTIREWKSVEERENDPVADKIVLRNRHCWDWWNLCASSDDELSYSKDKEHTSVPQQQRTGQRTGEDEFEEEARERNKKKGRSRSLPEISPNGIVENKYQRLKSFWESVSPSK